MYKLMWVLLFVTLFSFAADKPTYGSAFIDMTKEIKVIDGDTIRATIQGLPPLIGDFMPIRFLGVDAPETRRPECQKELHLALKAKAFVQQKITEAGQITIGQIQRGTFYRLVAVVYVDGTNLNELLLTEGLAVPETKGKNLGWCSES